ncbi:putative transcriptional regulator [Bdellovibrio bacteriovorus str. Tiberius]|uniref:Putative transcriptional regulator n=2 Tax=Bdellovibrio bacteriovorus TaxID=959 RepID=K7YS29_BDEBC|nr:putative transcriptional regulator [Bdellovibrio bacteriovorus str. Tiberius]
MVFIQKKEMKTRKNILIVDNNCELEQLVKEPLLKQLENSGVSPIVVRAKDGAEAAIKSENQKFDVVLIDTEVPRLMDGGFVYGIHTYKNTQDAELIVISQRDSSDLPESLQSSKFFKKPVSPNELINAMISVLNAQHHGTGAKEPATAAAASKYAVDVRVINAVIKATTHVLGQFGCPSVKMEKAGPKSPHDPMMGEVSSVVEIKSQAFQGHLCISFDKGSFLEVVSSMLMEEQTELNKDNQDAVGEINNIIFGNAKAEISSYGVQMTVPKVLLGNGQNVPCAQGSAGMMIPFATEKGKFYITVVALPLAKAA